METQHQTKKILGLIDLNNVQFWIGIIIGAGVVSIIQWMS